MVPIRAFVFARSSARETVGRTLIQFIVLSLLRNADIFMSNMLARK